MALAHSDNGNYGSDIPESLIWLLSFFFLIGLIFIVGSYFMYPDDPVTGSSGGKGVLYFRIHPSDLKQLGNFLRRKRDDEDSSNTV